MTILPSSLLQPESDKRTLLILSDGKPGHLNQSLAFARLLGCPYLVRDVRFRHRLGKAFSYLLDRFGILYQDLFRIEQPRPEVTMVVSAGSATYYANKVLAARLKARSVVLMWPAGYRTDFDLIVAQQHDRPPRLDNLLLLPVNLSAPVPSGIVPAGEKDKPCIAVIIGGPSSHFEFDLTTLEVQLRQLMQLFPDGDFLVTTSRRTPVEVDRLLERLPFRFRLLYSQSSENPIADFLEQADVLFVTEDSTSMISEAVCWGKAKVEVLPVVASAGENKVRNMVATLAGEGYLHVFDGTLGERSQKVDLRQLLRDAVPHSWFQVEAVAPSAGAVK